MRLVAMRLFVFLFFVALWESLSHIVLSNSPLPPNVLLAESRRRVDYCPVTAPVCRRPSLLSRTSLSRGLRKQPEEGSSDGISVTVSHVDTVVL